MLDTALGNKAAWSSADEVTAGLYIVVVEESDSNEPESPDNDDPDSSDDPYIHPQIPKTGDSSNVELCLVLMVISGVLLLMILLERRKERQ